MSGLLGTRGDLLSDLLLLALGVVVPALAAGVWLALTKRLRAHRAVMLSILGVLVAYVVVYEGNLAALGGTGYLLGKTHFAAPTYFTMVGFHVALGLSALVGGAWAVRRGQRAFSDRGRVREHLRVAWVGVALLALSAVTGAALYWVTFAA